MSKTLKAQHESPARSTFQIAAGWQPVARELGLDADAVFTHPDIRAWRKLPDRQNCTLDATLADGRRLRLHVKRYAPTRHDTTPAQDEVAGHEHLVHYDIPTANLVAWGAVADGRSFVIFEDLAGFTPADKLIEAGADFAQLSPIMADITARMHQAGLHHRDLYLCHFMVKTAGPQIDIRVIDPARVRRLPSFFNRGRWVVKDLAQFWYSTLKLPITQTARQDWLVHYCLQRQLPGHALMRGNIESKVKRIARHDAKLNRLKPNRNVSIPW